MALARLDHFTLRTRRLDETVDFFVRVLGLQVGPRPAFSFAGAWLYLDDRPVVHLAAPSDEPGDGLAAYLGETRALTPTGLLDHIAFRCTGYAGFRDRLAELDVAYRERVVPELAERQLFVEEPNGIVIELVFPAHERAGDEAEATVSASA